MKTLQDPDRYRGGSFLHVAWGEFERIRAQIRPHLDLKLPIWPGADIGPSIGKVAGKLTDITRSEICTMLISRDTDRRLKEGGITLSTFKAEIRARKGGTADLLDVEALPLASLSFECNSNPCCVCGFSSSETKFALDRKTIPKGIHVFRAKEDPSKLLLSEEFVELVGRLKLTGLPVAPVEVHGCRDDSVPLT